MPQRTAIDMKFEEDNSSFLIAIDAEANNRHLVRLQVRDSTGRVLHRTLSRVEDGEMHTLQSPTLRRPPLVAFSVLDQFQKLLDLGNWPDFYSVVLEVITGVKNASD